LSKDSSKQAARYMPIFFSKIPLYIGIKPEIIQQIG
jgi:hypothetical protein